MRQTDRQKDRERERERERDRQTDRQTDREGDRDKDRETETHRHTDRELRSQRYRNGRITPRGYVCQNIKRSFNPLCFRETIATTQQD